MNNEELMALYAEGDRSALDALCEQNRGLIRDRAERIAFLYHCYRFNDRGNPTAYTIELRSNLESEGMAAFIECVCGGKYNPEFMLTTYAVPFIDGAMRRYLESSMGTLAIDRGDEEVADLYDSLHPAVLMLVAHTLAGGEKAGVPVSICGEMAGNPKLTRLLLGMGLRHFSMHPSQILEVKKQILTSDVGQLAPMVRKLLRIDDPVQIREQIRRLNTTTAESSAR